MGELFTRLPDDLAQLILEENIVPEGRGRNDGENGRPDGYQVLHGDVCIHRDTPPNANAQIHRQLGSHETRKEKRRRKGR